MTLEHVAIWTNRHEELRDFYVTFFNGICSDKYTNTNTGFESYFITFEDGARLELMRRNGIPENLNNPIDQHLGIIHLAFHVNTMTEVDRISELFHKEGYEILRGPRKTGDGYYEFETLDPDNNRLEICTVWSE